jgi:nucleoside-diphosphate-sugar epimerase
MVWIARVESGADRLAMYHLLGNNGFIGKHLSAFMRDNHLPVNAVAKPVFDLTRPETYGAVNIQAGDTIIDCIARIDGTAEEIERVNVNGLRSFLEHLNSQNIICHYLYFSTCSTLLPEQRLANNYVRSKHQAEELLRRLHPNHKIIRLVFPFGIGEGPNRLISRLIRNIKSKAPIVIDDLTVNLTPISALMADFKNLLASADQEINYSTNQVYRLEEIVSYLFEKLGLKPTYQLSEKKVQILVESTERSAGARDDVWRELNQMLHE